MLGRDNGSRMDVTAVRAVQEPQSQEERPRRAKRLSAAKPFQVHAGAEQTAEPLGPVSPPVSGTVR